MPHLFLKTRYYLLFLLVFAALNTSAQGGHVIIKTNKGYLKGIVENGIDVFKGVPYAAPPVGRLRFMPPVEHAGWNDTLSATKFGEVAMQFSGGKVIGSEDCLLLNVYTPKPDLGKRAVVVWVHGGSMINGAGMYMDGHAFADNDNIVTVTINYRLGALGFLYLGDIDKRYAASGNCGLLDVIMALKWIKENISSFGGDPKNVTIMGESAGAKLISAVLVSPLSKGLFNRYIAESGSVQCIRDTGTAKNERLRFLKQMGLNRGDKQQLLNLGADSLIKIQGIVCAGIGGNSFFGPVYDGVTIRQDAYTYAESKSIPRIKALIGTNKDEAAAFFSKNDDLQKSNAAFLKSLFADNYPTVYNRYLDELKTNEPYGASVKVLTQYMYQMHSYRFARALAQNNIPVWVYRYDYANGKAYGARHGNELQFVWNQHNLSSSVDATKKQLALNMHGAWVAFIKTGNPNIKSLPPWPNYRDNARNIMVFDTDCGVKNLTEVYNDTGFPSAVFVIK